MRWPFHAPKLRPALFYGLSFGQNMIIAILYIPTKTICWWSKKSRGVNKCVSNGPCPTSSSSKTKLFFSTPKKCFEILCQILVQSHNPIDASKN